VPIMRPSIALQRYRERIRDVALRHRIAGISVFGSVLRGEDGDLDVLVEPNSETTYFDLGTIQYELSELLGMRVDVLTPESLPERFRQQVLDEAERL
jgi:uncharacterized protein